MPTYTLPELPYDYSALEPHYSGTIVELHHDKHHNAYVVGANETTEKLATARANNDFATVNSLEKNLAFHVSGHLLHSIFWTNMSANGGGKPEGELAAEIDESFGSFEAFRGQISKATELVQGSGWGALVWEPVSGRLVVQQIYDHQDNLTNGSLPLLAIDAWEHAYYLQYKNVRADWITAFWNIVNWEDVAARFKKVRSVSLP